MKTAQTSRRQPAARSLLFLISALLLFVLAACVPPAVPTDPIPDEPVPTGTSAPEEEPSEAAGSPFTPQFLGQFDPEDILVQFAEEPTFTLPEYRFEFGRVPPFTLLADGRLIYVDEMNDFRVMEVQLSPEETAALLAQVHALGYERLQDYTDMCMDAGNGEQMCVADASYHHVIVRMPDGSLRDVRNYHDFSNEPEVYRAIHAMLTEYTNPQAVQYTPEAATLFLREQADDGGMEAAEWPLDPAILDTPVSPEMGSAALALKGEDLKTYLGKLTSLGGTQVFEHEGRFFSARLVPWLPGVDYSDAIEAAFPTN